MKTLDKLNALVKKHGEQAVQRALRKEADKLFAEVFNPEVHELQQLRYKLSKMRDLP